MQVNTSKRLRNCTQKEFLPGNVIRYATDSEIRYWKRKKWITNVGGFYVLTEKGWREA